MVFPGSQMIYSTSLFLVTLHLLYNFTLLIILPLNLVIIDNKRYSNDYVLLLNLLSVKSLFSIHEKAIKFHAQQDAGSYTTETIKQNSDFRAKTTKGL